MLYEDKHTGNRGGIATLLHSGSHLKWANGLGQTCLMEYYDMYMYLCVDWLYHASLVVPFVNDPFHLLV